MLDGLADNLLRLSGLVVPPGAAFGGLEFHPRLDLFSVWLALMALGFLLARNSYGKETIPPKPALGRLLVSLRIGSLGAAGWLVLNPVGCTANLHGERPKPLAIILDDSRSMTRADARRGASDDPRPRYRLGQELLETVAGRLGKGSPLRYLAAGDTTRQIEPVASPGVSPWTSWNPAGNRSALGDSVMEAVSSPNPPGAIVLLTDGRQNSGIDLATAAKSASSRGIPLHLVGLGAPDPPSLLLRDLDIPDLLQTGERAVLKTKVRAVGLPQLDADQRLELTVEINGAVVAREFLATPRDGVEQQASIGFVVPKSGAGSAKVAVKARLAGAAGDVASIPLERETRLTDKPARILLVDAVPRWDFRFLLMQLVREAPAGLASPGPGTPAAPAVPANLGVAVAPSFVLLTGDKNLVTQEPFLPALPPRDEMARFDAIWLGDVDPRRLGPDGAETIRRFVEEGGGLILQAGPSFQPSAWAGTPLAELLPIEPAAARDAGNAAGPFRPKLTTDGLASDAMRLADNPAGTSALLDELPPLEWNAPVRRLKPGARALLIHPTRRAANGPEPLLATQSYGRGRVAWLGTDETWRWRLNAGEAHFSRFWTQWLVWASASRGDPIRRVRLSMDNREPRIGQNGELRARLLDANLAPDNRSRVPAEIQTIPGPGEGTVSGREVQLRAVPGQPGEFALSLIHEKAGRFRLRVPGEDGPGLQWTVSPTEDPEGPGGLALALLRQAANQAGTRLLLGSDALDLPDLVDPGKQPWSLSADLPRWHPGWFVLMTVCLGLEWGIRRRNQMS